VDVVGVGEGVGFLVGNLGFVVDFVVGDLFHKVNYHI
jgi:hypothetical protein